MDKESFGGIIMRKELKVIKEDSLNKKEYRVIKITEYQDTDRGKIVCGIKYIVQVKSIFIWTDIKEFEGFDEFVEIEAIELFDKIVNPYKYG